MPKTNFSKVLKRIVFGHQLQYVSLSARVTRIVQCCFLADRLALISCFTSVNLNNVHFFFIIVFGKNEIVRLMSFSSNKAKFQRGRDFFAYHCSPYYLVLATLSYRCRMAQNFEMRRSLVWGGKCWNSAHYLPQNTFVNVLTSHSVWFVWRWKNDVLKCYLPKFFHEDLRFFTLNSSTLD